MVNYRTVTLAVVGLFLSVSFLSSPVWAVEKDGLIMKDGKLWRMQDGKEIGRMDRETTVSNGTRVMMSGKMIMKGGKETQLQEGQTMMLDGKMKEGDKDIK
jgi:exopolysaccharide biosynthesis protein